MREALNSHSSKRWLYERHLCRWIANVHDLSFIVLTVVELHQFKGFFRLQRT